MFVVYFCVLFIFFYFSSSSAQMSVSRFFSPASSFSSNGLRFNSPWASFDGFSSLFPSFDVFGSTIKSSSSPEWSFYGFSSFRVLQLRIELHQAGFFSLFSFFLSLSSSVERQQVIQHPLVHQQLRNELGQPFQLSLELYQVRFVFILVFSLHFLKFFFFVLRLGTSSSC